MLAVYVHVHLPPGTQRLTATQPLHWLSTDTWPDQGLHCIPSQGHRLPLTTFVLVHVASGNSQRGPLDSGWPGLNEHSQLCALDTMGYIHTLSGHYGLHVYITQYYVWDTELGISWSMVFMTGDDSAPREEIEIELTC